MKEKTILTVRELLKIVAQEDINIDTPICIFDIEDGTRDDVFTDDIDFGLCYGQKEIWFMDININDRK